MRRLTTSVLVCLVAMGVSASVFAQRYPRTADQRKWNEPFEPFRIIGNIHYVGTADLASYLITSDQGHVLIDTGLEEDAAQLIASIARLGFSVRDVKVLLNTQAHFDHAAGLAAVKRLSGARLLASGKDAETLASGGKDDFALGDDLMFPAVKADGIVVDGQVVTVGPISLTAHVTPGHTKGATTWTTTVRDNGRELFVVFPASTTINPSVKTLDHPKYPEMRADFTRTYATLKSLKPDVFLAQHAGAFGLKDKAARLKRGESPNPFIDPEGYRRIIGLLEASFLKHP